LTLLLPIQTAWSQHSSVPAEAKAATTAGAIDSSSWPQLQAQQQQHEKQ
jgi:hypothetical protein